MAYLCCLKTQVSEFVASQKRVVRPSKRVTGSPPVEAEVAEGGGDGDSARRRRGGGGDGEGGGGEGGGEGGEGGGGGLGERNDLM